MILKFLGGTRTVTGSCFYIECNDLKILVESGIYQGENADEVNRADFDFRPEDISYIFITHAHLDHSGMIPRIVKEGFKGKIIMTPATRDLLELLLYDSANIQENDAGWHTRKAIRAGEPPVFPLYTINDVKNVIPLFDVKSYDKIFHLGNGIKYRFVDAGHILGSGTLELWFQDRGKEKKIVFSGDIGKKNNPIVRDPLTPAEADFVVMESTYGNRLHKPLKESIDELVDAIKITFKKGGNVFIPSFAVGRTQDLLYILNNLVKLGRLYRIDVYLDSPLAEEATRVYLAHPECFDDEARKLLSTGDIDSSIKLHFVKSVKESMDLNRIKSGIIVIAGSGMCEGGRITHHLKHNLWRSECSVIFVGFQGKGTLGRRIVNRAKAVQILGEEIAVKASVYTINGFSAHADQAELIEWLSAFKDSPEVFIVHGEEEVSISFGELVKDKFGFMTHIPSRGEVFEL
ncbi:MAG: MBL fold hydrolase [Nitrospirae bacterium RBG_13_39_12]|nr:MAG: MBL fold hydrolase [Nitrospirae bacterium RBG_13_39_12]